MVHPLLERPASAPPWILPRGRIRAWLRRFAGAHDRILAEVPWDEPRYVLLGLLLLVSATVNAAGAYALTSLTTGYFSLGVANVGTAFLWGGFLVVTVDRALVFPSGGSGSSPSRTSTSTSETGARRSLKPSSSRSKRIGRLSLALSNAVVVTVCLVTALFAHDALRQADAQFVRQQQVAIGQDQAAYNRASTLQSSAVAPEVSNLKSDITQLQAQIANAQSQVTADEQSCRGELTVGDPVAGRTGGNGSVAKALCSNVSSAEAVAAAVSTADGTTITQDEASLTAVESEQSPAEAAAEQRLRELRDERPPSAKTLGFWGVANAVDRAVPLWWRLGVSALLLSFDLVPLFAVASWSDSAYETVLRTGVTAHRLGLEDHIDEAEVSYKHAREARRRKPVEPSPEPSPPVASANKESAPPETAEADVVRFPASRTVGTVMDVPTVPYPVAPRPGGTMCVSGIEFDLGDVVSAGRHSLVLLASVTPAGSSVSAAFPRGLVVKTPNVGPTGLSDAESAERFEREARFYERMGQRDFIPRVAALELPNQGAPGAIVMERFPLGTLASWIKDPPVGVTAATVLGWFIDLFEASAVLWRMHLSHADTKPANVAVNGASGEALFETGWPHVPRSAGSLTLIDFDVARQLGQSPIAASGPFTPPEFRADSRQPSVISVESDVWACAATIAAVVSGVGRVPPQVVDDGRPGTIHQVNPVCPRALSSMLATLMSPHPAARIPGSSGLGARNLEARVSTLIAMVHDCYDLLVGRGEDRLVLVGPVSPTDPFGEAGRSDIDPVA